MFLDNISTELIESQGTDIGGALTMANESFEDTKKRNRAIILISDGEDQQDQALDIAKEVAGKGTRIYSIGMGSPSGAPIPLLKGNKQTGFKTDAEGKVVVSKLNEDMLQKIAAAGKGIYINASTNNVGLDNVFDDINKLEKTEFDSKLISDFEDRYQYALLPVIILLMIDLLIGERKSKLFAKVNLFGTKKE